MSPCIPHDETFEFLKESVYTYHEVPQICSKLVLFNFIFFSVLFNYVKSFANNSITVLWLEFYQSLYQIDTNGN